MTYQQSECSGGRIPNIKRHFDYVRIFGPLQLTNYRSCVHDEVFTASYMYTHTNALNRHTPSFLDILSAVCSIQTHIYNTEY